MPFRLRAWALLSIAIAACGGEPPPSDGERTDEEFVADTAGAHEKDTAAPSPAVEAGPTRPVIGTELPYGESSDRNLVGYLAMPEDAAEPLPGLIVIHEWWGLNDNIKAMTERLAGEGFIALAVDLYGGEVAADPAAAQGLMTELMGDPDAARANLEQAYGYLEQHAFSPRIGVIGWCLGGGYSLRAALWLPDKLDAAVMYYGRVIHDEGQLNALSAPLLGLFGEADQAIPVAQVKRFRSTLGRLGKPATVHIYSGADHAFANPTGRNYQAETAADAWRKTLEFLNRHLATSEQEPEQGEDSA